MKKLSYVAILAILLVCFACSKQQQPKDVADKLISELVTASSQSDVEAINNAFGEFVSTMSNKDLVDRVAAFKAVDESAFLDVEGWTNYDAGLKGWVNFVSEGKLNGLANYKRYKVLYIQTETEAKAHGIWED